VSADIWALACIHCRYRFPTDLTVGVMAAHFEAEHDTTDVQVELVVVCDRCDREMIHFATVGEQIHYQCEPCHRGRIIHQGQVPT
jgi:hypothetical protein